MNDEIMLLEELEELEDLEDLAEVESVKPMIAYMPRDESMFRVEDREDEEALERISIFETQLHYFIAFTAFLIF